MSDGIDIERAQREELRWYIIRALYAALPESLAEKVLLRIAEDIGQPEVTPRDIRRELVWLADQDLVHIRDRRNPVWLCQLTAKGVNVAEYSVECPPVIERPDKYW